MKTIGWKVVAACILSAAPLLRAGSPAAGPAESLAAGAGLYEEQVRSAVESAKRTLEDSVMCRGELWVPKDMDTDRARFVAKNKAKILGTSGVLSVCAAGSYGTRLSGSILVSLDEKSCEKKVAAELVRSIPEFKVFLDNFRVVFFGFGKC